VGRLGLGLGIGLELVLALGFTVRDRVSFNVALLRVYFIHVYSVDGAI